MATIPCLYFFKKSIDAWKVIKWLSKRDTTGWPSSQSGIKAHSRMRIQGLVKCKIWIFLNQLPKSWTRFPTTLWSKLCVFYMKLKTGLLSSVYTSDMKHLLLDLEHQEVPKVGKKKKKKKRVRQLKMIPLWLQSVHLLSCFLIWSLENVRLFGAVLSHT